MRTKRDSITTTNALPFRSDAPMPLVAIIGRPNVGKSTLFNKILGVKTAIVDDVPGVTRDRNYADASYRERKFRLVDTGGLDLSASDGMLPLIRRQSELAIAEADILMFILDGRTGLTPPDHEVVKLLRGVTKPIFYVINKIDTPKVELPTGWRSISLVVLDEPVFANAGPFELSRVQASQNTRSVGTFY